MRKDIIKKILYGYVQQKSISDTDVEKTAETFFVEFFAKQEYFKKNKEYYWNVSDRRRSSSSCGFLGYGKRRRGSLCCTNPSQ